MSAYDYLAAGLAGSGGLAPQLAENVPRTSDAWMEAGVDPAQVEILAEFLARMAAHLGDARARAAELEQAVAHQEPPEAVLEFLRVAWGSDLGALELAALAVHLLDVAERMAIEIFVPELAGLTARSDESAKDARASGLARRLKG